MEYSRSYSTGQSSSKYLAQHVCAFLVEKWLAIFFSVAPYGAAAAYLSWVFLDNFDEFVIQWSAMPTPKKKKVMWKQLGRVIIWSIWVESRTNVKRQITSLFHLKFDYKSYVLLE